MFTRCQVFDIAVKRALVLLLVTGCLLVSSLGQAQLYRWQDAFGNWHFSDEPPPEAGVDRPASEVERFTPKPNIEDSSAPPPPSAEPKGSNKPAAGAQRPSTASNASNSIAQRLREKFPDAAPIARSTLAVVTIKTELGHGSGFFVTPEGHLVTNRHVVRPGRTKAIEQELAELEARKRALAEMNRKLNAEKLALQKFKNEIEEHEDVVDSKTEGSTAQKMAQKQHERYLSQYKTRQRELQSAQRSFRDKRKEITDLNSELNFKVSMSNVSRRFKVMLKDDSEVWANLVGISKNYDLALLKVDTQETPFLTRAFGGAVSQGISVFAIGSSLGLRDSVTKGIITGEKEGLIMTDTQILPGNSGGPLVTEWGDVIGVNTSKLGQAVNREGFGLAIPIGHVFETFRDKIPEIYTTPMQQ